MEGNYELLKCLQDIPAVLQEIMDERDKITEDFVREFCGRDIKKIYFSGQASGTYIGEMLKPFIEDCFHIEVQVTNPYEFVTNESFNVNGMYAASQICMICPAHSGSTPGPVRMAEMCREQGICVVTTTYDLSSPLAELSDVVINKHSAEEVSYIETRGHFASMMCLYLCFLEYGKRKRIFGKEQYEIYLGELRDTISNLRKIVQDTETWYNQNKQILLDADKIRYIASGEYVAAVLEGGLKIAETTHKSRLVYELEEFLHSGTTEIKKDSVIFLLMPENRSYNRMKELESWCRRYSVRVVPVCAAGNQDCYENELRVAGQDYPYFSVMEYILPFEVLAYLLSEDLHMSVVVSANDEYYDSLKVHIG